MADHRHSFENMEHALDRVRARGRERRAALEELPQVAFEASSPDGSLTVTADWQGVLTGVKLAQGAVDMPATQVVDNILSAYGHAQQASARRAAEILQVDPDSEHPVHRSILGRVSFEPAAEHSTAQETAQPAGNPTPDSHDDEGNGFQFSSYRA